MSFLNYPKPYKTSFESLADFEGFYITPPGDYNTTHELTTEKSVTGSYSHKGTLLAANDVDNLNSMGYLPHRGYPTFQFQKTIAGVYKAPCIIRLKIWLDILLQFRPGLNDWFSPLTGTADETEGWADVVTLGIGPTHYLGFEHVPTFDKADHIYQASALNGGPQFPMREWVDIRVEVAGDGILSAFQNEALVSKARVDQFSGIIAQMHAGMYASAACYYALDGINPAVVYNDDFSIEEIGGGGGGRRKFKSYDQRQRERAEAISKDAQERATIAAAKTDPAQPIQKQIQPAPAKPSRANDDEEAIRVIAGLL